MSRCPAGVTVWNALWHGCRRIFKPWACNETSRQDRHRHRCGLGLRRGIAKRLPRRARGRRQRLERRRRDAWRGEIVSAGGRALPCRRRRSKDADVVRSSARSTIRRPACRREQRRHDARNQPMLDVAEDEFDRIFGSTSRACSSPRGTRCRIPRKRDGVIITIASTAAFVRGPGSPGTTAARARPSSRRARWRPSSRPTTSAST